MFYINFNIICWVRSHLLCGLHDLLYIIKKPHVYGQITEWLLLFLEYNFLVIYKCPGLVANMLSRLLNSIENLKVLNQTIHVTLFTMQSIFGYKKFKTTSVLEIFQYNIHMTKFFFDFYSLTFHLD
jgi:hypothetical protein